MPWVTAQEEVGPSQSPHTFGLAALSTHSSPWEIKEKVLGPLRPR